ncbi:MAG: hypothetical protein J6N71_03270 [Muribaculaceae bacterium]|nr:hypothetical protein [Muribaculaceae bacterium]MBR3101907.1 hypothetical protein [Muribaculaceae bacterium]
MKRFVESTEIRNKLKTTLDIIRVIVLLAVIVLQMLFIKATHYWLIDKIQSIEAENEEAIDFRVPVDKVPMYEALSKTGDKHAYMELDYYFMNEPPEGAMLAHSIIMANKFGDRYACNNVYYTIMDFYGNGTIDSLDIESQKLAIRFLKRGVELNDSCSILNMNKLKAEGNWKKEYDDPLY